MRSFTLNVGIHGDSEESDDLWTTATVYLPEQLPERVTVLFGFPGGGFGRKYYDIQALPGYSQAEFHTAAGYVFVACDHLYVGDSARPEDPLALSFEDLAAANHATAVEVITQLRGGTLTPDVPPLEIVRTVAMGQSMGGCLLTVQQANHRTFDAVAFLGWSGIFTNFPTPEGGRDILPLPPRGTDMHPIADAVLGVVSPDVDQFRFCFHWPDVEPSLLAADIDSYRPFSDVVRGDEASPWGSATTPPCALTMMTEGAVSAEAAAIDVPVLVACGERDVVPDPWAEPSAYRSSADVSVAVIPRMAHMHNFASTRERLWDRIAAFAETVPPSATLPLERQETAELPVG